MTLSEIILSGKERLHSAKLECADPALHMVQIAAAALNIEPSSVYLKWDEPIGSGADKIEAILKRRLTGEPFQYIVGYEWFWNSKFEVGPGVLIPRRETECLIEFILEKFPEGAQTVVELGAGSGNIGVSALLERPAWRWHGYEISDDARKYLEKNVQTLAPGSAYTVHPGDFFKQTPGTLYDALVANPPYVPQGNLATLSKEVGHEPRLALDGGEKGMDVIEKLARIGKTLVRSGGFLVLEIGYDQEALGKLCLTSEGWLDVECRKDYAGLPRVLTGRRPQ